MCCWVCLFTWGSVHPDHPSLLWLMAVTERRGHWRAAARAPCMARTRRGTASAQTAWLGMQMAVASSARTVHLSVNIPDASTPALWASPAKPARWLHKARLRLKSTRFRSLWCFWNPDRRVPLSVARRAKTEGMTTDSNVNTTQVFVHTVREWAVSFWMILLIIKCFSTFQSLGAIHSLQRQQEKY